MVDRQRDMERFDLEPDFRKQLYVEFSDAVFSKTVILVLIQILFFVVFGVLMESNANRRF